MNPLLKVVAEQQGGVFARHQALSSGYTPGQIRRRLADRRWVRIRHGQYAERVDLSALPAWDQAREEHCRLVHAVMNSWRKGSIVVSHQSALALHGLPLWGLNLEQVHVTQRDGQVGGVVAGVRHHLGSLSNADLTEARGLSATTIARAVIETACTTSFEAAVVGVDMAMRAGALDPTEVDRLLGLVEFWTGSPTARAAVAFGDPRSESVGESRLRVLMHNHGLPAPDLQAEFSDADGLIGRVDFFFTDYGTVVEFDGRAKYGEGTADVLVREKFREDRLRALGFQVVRADWTAFNRPHHLVAGIRQAFTRARQAA